MNLKYYAMAGVVVSVAALAGGTAYAAPCPNINGVTTCNVVITAGPGGSFTTTVPNPTPMTVPTITSSVSSTIRGPR